MIILRIYYGDKMLQLELRALRCPLALITLKKYLMKPERKGQSVSLLFQSNIAMKDICYYLDYKKITYDLLFDQKVVQQQINDQNVPYLIRIKGSSHV